MKRPLTLVSAIFAAKVIGCMLVKSVVAVPSAAMVSLTPPPPVTPAGPWTEVLCHVPTRHEATAPAAAEVAGGGVGLGVGVAEPSVHAEAPIAAAASTTKTDIRIGNSFYRFAAFGTPGDSIYA
jgi:hypothetical protein